MPGNEYQSFPCDLCGCSRAVEVPNCREYTNNQPIHICQGCGFVYVVQRRSSRAIADDWSEEIFGDGYTAAIPAVRARLTYVADFVNNYLGLSGKRVCDIGAGEGEFLNIIRQGDYGASVFGVEPSRRNCQLLGQRGIEHFNGTIEEYSRSAELAEPVTDIVTINWTLENCQSCRGMLGAAHRILKDGGHVVVATGSRILVPFKKPLHYYFGDNRADTHAFRFSANTLGGILAVSGFAIAQVNRYLDSDVLCVIARKESASEEIPWTGDNYLEVYSFFERWHVDTRMYYPEAAGAETLPLPGQPRPGDR